MPINQLPSPRFTNLLIALATTALIITALVLQHVVGLHPCPLCITQRVFVIVVGVLALFAALHNPGLTGRRIYAGLQILAAIGGMIVAGRHLWIQNLPEDQVPSCGPGLEYIFENFPVSQALELLFSGDGNCHEVVWRFLGVSIPGWVMICCVGLLLVNVWQLFRK